MLKTHHRDRIHLLPAAALAALAALTASPASAIVVNNNYFTSSGGDIADIVGTLDAGYADATAYSFAPQFSAVGTIGQCTATWIGDSADGTLSYILTAAHCLPDDQLVNPIADERFRDGLGNDFADGAGTFYVPPQRIDRPPGFGGASTDIGILVLPRIASILDANGLPIAQPLLYDGNNELNHPVTLNGYGSWGIGTEGSSGSYQPTNPPRRAAGTNTIDRIIEMDHGLTAEFDAPGTGDHTPFESAVASGDSGSAWWQLHDGLWTIIGTTNGGSGSSYDRFSTAARVSAYADWIRSIFPGARFYSDEINNTLAGDINNDGYVGDEDLSLILTNWNQTVTPGTMTLGELNGDGLINQSDLNIVLNNWGQGTPPTNIPEPTSLAILTLGLGLLQRRR